MPRWILLCLMFVPQTVLAQTVVLDANFDNKTVDAAVGTGGAAVGEPVGADAPLQATIRSTPFATPSLELHDTLDFGARFVRFRFDPEIDYSSGVVDMQMDLWMAEMDDYLVYIRRIGSSAEAFLSLRIQASGSMLVSDSGGVVGTFTSVYTTAQSVHLQFTFDMDAGTYDVRLDGALLVDDEPHNVDPSLGVGSLHIGMDHDADLDGLMYVDNVLVTATVPTAVQSSTMGFMKALYFDR